MILCSTLMRKKITTRSSAYFHFILDKFARQLYLKLNAMLYIYCRERLLNKCSIEIVFIHLLDTKGK